MSQSQKKIAIVGAGPGGLTAGMLLAKNGYSVDIFEKQPAVGGRSAAVELGEFTFDLGPTFLMMKNILEDMFRLTGRKVEDYLDLREVDPLYRLAFADGRELRPSRQDKEGTIRQIEELFPGNGAGYEAFLDQEKIKYDKVEPCLRIPYNSPLDTLRSTFLKALPYMNAHKSLHSHLGKYFDDEQLKLAFTFQSKYLGMSPWECPATFSIIPFIEHHGGIWHTIGGLNKISHAMAQVIEEEGGRIHLSTPVEEVLVKDGRAVGVRINGGEIFETDYVVVNADFAHAMNKLVDAQHLKRWKPEKIDKKRFSISTYMLYLGLDRIYEDVPHHSILFAEDYKRNVDEMTKSLELSQDPSVYVQNASVLDPTLAPPGKSAVYVLVPAPNLRADIDWDQESAAYRERILDILETRGGLTNIRDHIEVEKIITPQDWQEEHNVYLGATFNLAHSVDQMLFLRPHNKFEEFENTYLVGGGTHPGSGLPTIYESAKISANMIMNADGIELAEPPVETAPIATVQPNRFAA